MYGAGRGTFFKGCLLHLSLKGRKASRKYTFKESIIRAERNVKTKTCGEKILVHPTLLPVAEGAPSRSGCTSAGGCARGTAKQLQNS